MQETRTLCLKFFEISLSKDEVPTNLTSYSKTFVFSISSFIPILSDVSAAFLTTVNSEH